MHKNTPGKHIMIIAGEASGDLHGANLARELIFLDGSLRLSGIGGTGMARAGVRLHYDISRLAVMGIIEVFNRLKDIRSAMKILEECFRKDPPDLLILIDYPGFNLALARKAKNYAIPVLYYISPKIWAWREGRIERIKKYVDRMAVILPFEKKFYRKHGVEVDFVGNPLLDQVRVGMTVDAYRKKTGIDPDAVVVGIMPGSRRQEISELLPLFLEAAKLLQSDIRRCIFLIPLASTLTEEDVMTHVGRVENLDIRIVKDDRYEAMAACNAALAASGTLTMELAILGVPMVVCYRVSLASYLVAKPFIKVRYASLVNLVAEKEVVPELLQGRVAPQKIHAKMLPLLLDGKAREAMQQELERVCERLGEPGASGRAAKIALEMVA